VSRRIKTELVVRPRLTTLATVSLGGSLTVAQAAAELGEIPSHVDPRLVVDYDMFADWRYAQAGDPHSGLRKLADDTGYGIRWTPRNGGHWFINDYELCFQAARDPGLFSSRAMTLPPMRADLEPKLIPLMLDPPEHGPYRIPLMRAFAPEKMKALDPAIREFAAELIEPLRGAKRCDFVHAIAEPLPIIMFMRLMGLETSRLAEFRTWMADMMSAEEAPRARSHQNIREMMAELISARQQRRENDLISYLLDSTVAGRPITVEELHGYCILLFSAGLDTVANAMAHSMRHLALDPTLQTRLRDDPRLIPETIEEFLRRYGVTAPPRTVTRDAEFGGARLKAGERVVLLLPACNLDADAFPDPDRVDIERQNKVHLTFNAGPHRCVGSHLARLEIKILFEEWFARMPNVRLDPAAPPEYRLGITLACVKLPLVWD
jgi:cytochrome P450